MNNTSMHFCLEAKDDNNDTVYLIYEVNYIELLWFYDPPAPLKIFNQVAIIRGGVPSMGCGVFNSKIVLAGGIGKRKNRGESNRHKGVITYDIITQEVSKEDIPSMRGCKVNPLVFQLNNKLFVFDTYFKPHRRSFEVYYPKQNIWHNLRIPYYAADSAYVRAYSSSGGISRYSWFPFGDCFYVSLPKDSCAYFHHAKDRLNRSIMASSEPLPFRGMATTYYQEGFDDVVVISFSNGLVEGRRFVMPDHFSENSVLILDTKKRSGYKKEMTGCFADLGGGNFCLTTFDKEYIHIYVFMIHRSPCENGEDLNLEVRQSKLHKYKYEDFSGKGCQSFKFSGCFSPLGNDRIKEKVKAEAALHCRDFPFFSTCSWGNKKDIDVPGVRLSQYTDVDDTDSDYYGESDYDYSHYNA